jgi:hypothetical protein
MMCVGKKYSSFVSLAFAIKREGTCGNVMWIYLARRQFFE